MFWLTNFQSVIVGGVGRDGNDATNELSYILLEIMDELRMKQPNYQARIHSRAPKEYLDKVYDVLARGSASPSLYNDDVIVETMTKNGYKPEDARDYAAIGCVEPAAQGKSFSSTDAAVFNTPMALELALNQGRRFGGLRRCLGANEGNSTQNPRISILFWMAYLLSQPQISHSQRHNQGQADQSPGRRGPSHQSR